MHPLTESVQCFQRFRMILEFRKMKTGIILKRRDFGLKVFIGHEIKKVSKTLQRPDPG
jgi:hypothetical protein